MQSVRKMPRAPVLVPAKIAQIAGAIRALCVIYNTSLTYETTHAIFQKAIDERMHLFHDALAGTEGISLVFSDGQIRIGTISVEPGSSMFSRLSREFENMGIACISLLPGLSGDDLRKFMRLATKEADAIRARGLQLLLDRDGIRTVLEHKVRTELASGADKKGAAAFPAHEIADHPAKTDAWDIEADAASGVFTLQEEDDARFTRPFRDFVKGTMDALRRKEADVENIADIIATEFQHRLNEKTEEIRRTSEKKIRRLESVQELILRALEAHNLAAVILDQNMSILSANRQGREIIGGITFLERGSELETFIRSHEERKEVEINGVRKFAHLLTSTAVHGETIMLVSLE